ncbi:MAG TPA: WecB/TagA/CpsF family glycosyltransferase [Beijerinckiaceae bacterium]|nr:WecB/TagA/CpsF family glycosyltransferase [Beijerinckiaceae bacterium]
MASHPEGTLATIDGQIVNIAAQAEVIDKATARANTGLGFTLFTLNLDHLVKRRADAAFRMAYGRATFVTADGAPIAALARLGGVRIERVTGADLVLPLCAAAAEQRLPVYLFGSSHETLKRAAADLVNRFPALDICGLEAPAQGFDPLSASAQDAGERIIRSGAKLCFVALGAPKQELFADRMVAASGGIGFVCIGAALDFLASAQVRAPSILRQLGLEWAWRLFSDPRRMAMRYARCVVLLAELVLLQPLKQRSSRIGPQHRPMDKLDPEKQDI